MLSHIQLSSVSVDEHSMRQPRVDMSMTRTLTRLRVPSRIVAVSRSAMRSTLRRSVCCRCCCA